MVRKLWRTVALTALTVMTAVLALAVPVSTSSAAATVRIMPLGDSITAGTGCWRAYLWNRLQTQGYTGIDFVGGVSDGGGCNPGFTYDTDHEGHGGYSATGIAANDQLPAWLDAADPDVVLMHLGTNDMWGGYIALDAKLAAFTKLVAQMRANNPSVTILVAQIIPMSEAACATCPADVVAFNKALPAWAAGLTTAQSPIGVVDQWTGFDALTDTNDGVHPNDAGYRKMAERWYPALASVLDGSIVTPTTPATTSPTASPTPTVSPSVSPTASPTGSPTASPTATPTTPTTGATTPAGTTGCAATYRVVGQWPSGFQGEVTVRNEGTTPATGWSAVLTFGSGQQLTQAWSATGTQTGAVATFQNMNWNGSLPAGGTTSFGFQGSWEGANTGTQVTCTIR